MKKRHGSYLVLVVFFSVLLAGGCGSSKDSPGVTVSATITPTYNGMNTSSVDAVQSLCVSGTTTQSEYFSDHTATATFSASLINSSNLVDQLTVYIDSYTVDYASSSDSPGAPPIQSDTRSQSVSFIVSGGTTSADATTTATTTVELVDLVRKDQYLSDVTSGGYSSSSDYLNNYTATYTFSGHGENGVHFTATAQTNFQIGNFNYCPSGYSTQ